MDCDQDPEQPSDHVHPAASRATAQGAWRAEVRRVRSGEMQRDAVSATRFAAMAAMAAIAALAVLAQDWSAAGTAIGWLGFNFFMRWWLARDRFGPRLDLDRFRIDPVSQECDCGAGDLDPLGLRMVAVVVGLEAAVLFIGAVVLRASLSILLIGIVAVIPVSITIARAIARRAHPPSR
jgi:hypothetical protein